MPMKAAPHIHKSMPEDRIRWVMDYLKGKGLTIEDEPVLQLSQAVAQIKALHARIAVLERAYCHRPLHEPSEVPLEPAPMDH